MKPSGSRSSDIPGEFTAGSQQVWLASPMFARIGKDMAHDASQQMVGCPRETAACPFCLKPHAKVGSLVAGPGVYICDTCVQLAAQRSSPTSPSARIRRPNCRCGSRFPQSTGCSGNPHALPRPAIWSTGIWPGGYRGRAIRVRVGRRSVNRSAWHGNRHGNGSPIARADRRHPSQGPMRRNASSMSLVGPAKDSRTNEPPRTVSKSIPGAMATPVSANSFEQNDNESSVNSLTSA